MAGKIVNGDKLSEYSIDINGQGACFLDYNHDGFQDIFLVNGTSRKLEAAGQHPHDYLFRNNGNRTFTDVTRQAHLGDSGWHSGCAVGDYNNDGYLDIYATSFGPNKLYRNNGNGTFTEVAEAAGVSDPHRPFPKWSMGSFATMMAMAISTCMSRTSPRWTRNTFLPGQVRPALAC